MLKVQRRLLPNSKESVQNLLKGRRLNVKIAINENISSKNIELK